MHALSDNLLNERIIRYNSFIIRMQWRKTQGRRAGTRVIILSDNYCLPLPAATAAVWAVG
jgi:hypothetical protein